MELEEMKTQWDILNTQLKNNEIFNKKVMREIIYSRSESIVNKMFRYEMVGVIIVSIIMAIFLIIFLVNPNANIKIVFIVLAGALVPCLLSQFYKISILNKIKPDVNQLIESLSSITKYKRYNKIELFVSQIYGLLIVICSLLVAPVFSWLALLTGAILMLIFLPIEISYYNKNIRTLDNVFDELKEYAE